MDREKRTRRLAWRRPSLQTLASAAAVLALVGGWELASLIGPSYAIPSWERIFQALLEISLKDVMITVLRLVTSMIASFVAGAWRYPLPLFERPIAEAFWMPFVRLLMAVPCRLLGGVRHPVVLERGAANFLRDVRGLRTGVFIVDSLDAMKGRSGRASADGGVVPAERGSRCSPR